MKCAKPTWIVPLRLRAKIACLSLPYLTGAAMAVAQTPVLVDQGPHHIRVGAERTAEYIPLLEGRRVAVVTNQTGMIGSTHLVDSLLAREVDVVKVFAPEHGFRGEADAGAHVVDQKDQRTGLPILSLYGSSKKPVPSQLADIDVLVFDIQDVGVRFYTYISTLHYIMEAAAEQGKEVIVLDRPNPNGFYVDGPVLDMRHASYVGMHPVPLVHGMTIGEFARMINGEGWLKGGEACALTVIPCEDYGHAMIYEPPVRPSPNLPNLSAILLYPSLGLFEGTIVSVGRGTNIPFQCIGYPGNPIGDFTFTPVPMPGAMDPPHKGKLCRGFDLEAYGAFQSRMDRRIRLHWIIGLVKEASDPETFFLANGYFDRLAGGTDLRQQILAGDDEDVIRASWEPALDRFMAVRAKYLLYTDFSP